MQLQSFVTVGVKNYSGAVKMTSPFINMDYSCLWKDRNTAPEFCHQGNALGLATFCYDTPINQNGLLLLHHIQNFTTIKEGWTDELCSGL